MTMRRWRAIVVSGVLFATASVGSSGCSTHGADDSVGGYTNWLPCETLDDCPLDHDPRAAACTSGYCVDAEGERLLRPSSEQAGAGAGQSAGVGAGQGAGAGAGQNAGQGGLSGMGGMLDGGSGDAAVGDAGETGPICGAVRCPLGDVCCDHCSGACISALSGAHCPDDTTSNRSCDDAGIDAGMPIRIPECPGTMERCASATCVAGQPCVSCPVGTVCLELNLSCGPAGGSTAQCINDPCAGAPLDCACGSWACAVADPSGVLAFCSTFAAGQAPIGPDDAPILSCSGGGICASPDTPIATPRGDVPIASLRPGDLVYSLHEGQVVAVPLLAVSRTPVTHHSVVRLELEDGSVLEISAPHPLLDGRTLGALRVGEELDGLTVIGSAQIDYTHPYTHDVLPASDSRAYLVHGVWLGSTL